MKIEIKGTHENWRVTLYQSMFSATGIVKQGKFEAPNTVTLIPDWYYETMVVKVWCEHGGLFDAEVSYRDLKIGPVCSVTE